GDGGISRVERTGPRPIRWETTKDSLRPYRRRNQIAMSKLPFRPEGPEGSVEQYLPKVQNAIVKALTQAQKGLSHDTLRLDRPNLKTLAGILVEFVEDLHCEIGIWRSLERYNTEFFGTPLPFLFEPRTVFPLDAISPTRLQHFLWILYPQLIPDLLLYQTTPIWFVWRKSPPKSYRSSSPISPRTRASSTSWGLPTSRAGKSSESWSGSAPDRISSAFSASGTLKSRTLSFQTSGSSTTSSASNAPNGRGLGRLRSSPACWTFLRSGAPTCSRGPSDTTPRSRCYRATRRRSRS